jgi:hypothetical protein
MNRRSSAAAPVSTINSPARNHLARKRMTLPLECSLLHDRRIRSFPHELKTFWVALLVLGFGYFARGQTGDSGVPREAV